MASDDDAIANPQGELLQPPCQPQGQGSATAIPAELINSVSGIHDYAAMRDEPVRSCRQNSGKSHIQHVAQRWPNAYEEPKESDD
jgi:hypothetical protein